MPTIGTSSCMNSVCRSTRRKLFWDLASMLNTSARIPSQETAHLRWPLSAACWRSEEHTSELQSLMRISYAVFCLKKKTHTYKEEYISTRHKLITHSPHANK